MPDHVSSPVKEASTRPNSDSKKHFQFVDSSKPGRKDLETRKLIRRHVRNEFVRLNGRKIRGQKKTDVDEQGGVEARLGTPSTSSTLDSEESPRGSVDLKVPMPFGYPTETSGYPIEMGNETHALLSHYLTHVSKRMYPITGLNLKSNPLQSPEWFHFATTDSAMFHAILYAAAVWLALAQGWRESRDTIYYRSQTIAVVQQRLGDDSTHLTADATLGAISCLALGEAVSGNEQLWRMHMEGLKNMMLSRGDISSLSPLMLAKLRRSDITGAIEYAATPLLQFPRSPNEPTWSIVPERWLTETCSGLSLILLKSGVHADIASAMIELAYFTQAIRMASSIIDLSLDPAAFAEDLYWIEHSLLLIPDSAEQSINKACRLGALLYVKAILQEFPHSATGASVLTHQLRESLDSIYMTEDNVFLLTWLALVGAMSSKAGDRIWFIIYSKQSTNIGGILPFDDGALPLTRFFDLRRVFGRLLDAIWEEILATSVMNTLDIDYETEIATT
ncbi:uncharacterized protein PAC_02883 [Phialocephala subalpina]|uniref:Tachykinin family protein n=1 Tax=Phialocephala subalpina TaxID=576137 RepID=A0A1L7WJP7_9HELO|nr:uncharacterized protein PAC_02883 [Phialocephala subalpina]